MVVSKQQEVCFLAPTQTVNPVQILFALEFFTEVVGILRLKLG